MNNFVKFSKNHPGNNKLQRKMKNASKQRIKQEQNFKLKHFPPECAFFLGLYIDPADDSGRPNAALLTDHSRMRTLAQ